jgi:hypothetical protein
MSAYVAVSSMISAVPTAPWVAGPITPTLGTKISVNGSKVVLSASCTFTSPNPPFTDLVTLNAGSTVLTDNGSNVLKLGDSITSTQGNKLSVVAGQTKLKTA